MGKKHQIKISAKATRSKANRSWRREAKRKTNAYLTTSRGGKSKPIKQLATPIGKNTRKAIEQLNSEKVEGPLQERLKDLTLREEI